MYEAQGYRIPLPESEEGASGFSNIEPFNKKDYQAASLFTKAIGVPTFAMEQTGVLRTNCIE